MKNLIRGCIITMIVLLCILLIAFTVHWIETKASPLEYWIGFLIIVATIIVLAYREVSINRPRKLNHHQRKLKKKDYKEPKPTVFKYGYCFAWIRHRVTKKNGTWGCKICGLTYQKCQDKEQERKKSKLVEKRF